MSATPRVSVIITTKNRHDELARTLAALQAQEGIDLEVIVNDDGSQPPVGADLPVTRLLRSEKSEGVSAGRNRAAAQASGDFLVNLDDDVEPRSASMLRDAVALAERVPSAGVIGFRQYRPDGTLHYLQPVQSEQLCRAPRFFGYAFLIRRETFERTRGFYGPFVFGAEEIELSLRVLDAGYQILYAPQLQVTHHESVRERDWGRMERMSLRNSLCTAILRYPWWMVLPGMIIHIRRAMWLAKERGASRPALLRRALAETAGVLPGILRDRKPVAFRTLRLTRRLSRHPEPIDA